MKISCIRQPQNTRYLQIHEWQIKFCEGNHCAALLLSFFSNWHDWKIKHDQYYSKANNIAESHGDGRPHTENAYLFFTTEELIEGTMNFYGKTAINEAIQLLISLKVITIHKNPNPRYCFDKTKYFQFYPSVCNKWIDDTYSNKHEEKIAQVVDSFDQPKVADRLSENSRRSAENSQPSAESSQAITNTTNNTTNQYQSINVREDFFDEKNMEARTTTQKSKAKTVIEVLSQQGLATKHFKYPDVAETIQRLCDAGATVEIFVEAYSIARNVSSKGFGINYLVKVVMDILAKKTNASIKNANARITESRPQYVEDFSKGLDWIGDLI